jgi:hypothetical protein
MKMNSPWENWEGETGCWLDGEKVFSPETAVSDDFPSYQ